MKLLQPLAGYQIKRSILLVLCTIGVLAAVPAQAALSFAKIFTSNMVLQREMPVNVWGFGAGSNATVTVTFNGQTSSTTAAADGSWRVVLNPMSANATGQNITASSGAESQTYTNVVVGEVWMCGGQSNMARDFSTDISKGYTQREADRLVANYPNIRFKNVLQDVKAQPLSDLRHGPYKRSADAPKEFWRAVTPTTVNSSFSLAYYFGKKLHETLGVPVGLIQFAQSGSDGYSWVREGPLTNAMPASFIQDAYDASDADLLAEGYASWQALEDAIDAWDANPSPTGSRPASYSGGQGLLGNRPCVRFNGIVNPIVGYTLRGMIWHRGEGPTAYDKHAILFKTMVDDYRALWGQQFHVITGTLCNDGDPFTNATPVAVTNAIVINEQYLLNLRDRAAQKREILDYDLVSFFDLGNYWRDDISESVKTANGVHFEAKDVGGERMAVTALDSVYGLTNPDYRTPIPNRAVLEANGRVRISFDNVGSGLTLITNNFIGSNKCFVVKATNGTLYWGDVTVDGNDVVVWNDSTTSPAEIYYAWHKNPKITLYNSAGLPALYFRVTACATPFAGWTTVYGLTNVAVSGATADPDGDGLANLLEYGLGTHPNLFNFEVTDGIWNGLPAMGGRRLRPHVDIHPRCRAVQHHLIRGILNESDRLS